MDPSSGLRSEILLVPIKILGSFLRGNFSCVSKKPDTYYETGIYKIEMGDYSHYKRLFSLQKTSGYYGAVLKYIQVFLAKF